MSRSRNGSSTRRRSPPDSLIRRPGPDPGLPAFSPGRSCGRFCFGAYGATERLRHPREGGQGRPGLLGRNAPHRILRTSGSQQFSHEGAFHELPAALDPAAPCGPLTGAILSTSHNINVIEQPAHAFWRIAWLSPDRKKVAPAQRKGIRCNLRSRLSPTCDSIFAFPIKDLQFAPPDLSLFPDGRRGQPLM